MTLFADGLAHSGAKIALTATDTITYSLPQSTQNWGAVGGQVGVSWIIENTDTNDSTKMIVQHLDPDERLEADISEGPNNEEDEWSVIVNTYRDESETSIEGTSAQSGGTGVAFPRGSVSYTLHNSTAVKVWQSDDGQPIEYTFSVIQWPRSNVDVSLDLGSTNNFEIWKSGDLTWDNGELVCSASLTDVNANTISCLSDGIQNDDPLQSSD